MQEHNSRDGEVSTAPYIDADRELDELRAENQRLRSLLRQHAIHPDADVPSTIETWPTAVEYDQQPLSGARLMGLTKDRERIRPASDFPELPRPSTDQASLEADFVRWGYCIVADAMRPGQIDAQVARMLDQAAAERAAKVAHMSHRGRAQLLFNLLPKGQAFRDLMALEPSAAQGAPLVETLLAKILGDGYYLGTAHGSIVHQGGGRQELHQDQGFVPLPHPPYPLYCLIIWTYTRFSLEEGGTYIVPGSHRDAGGNNKVHADAAFEDLARDGLVALEAPPGCCVLTDSRLLHSGGKRTAPGTRLAARILYARAVMRQQENQIACASDDLLETLSPKLKGLIGYKPFYGLGMIDGNAINPMKPKVPIGELSMSDPEAFEQDFDWRYSEDARRLAGLDWDTHVEYRGPDPDR
ncbi:MAG: phytanoyl-CoA dioxygenase family protein [Pseudomonadota bacterium]